MPGQLISMPAFLVQITIPVVLALFHVVGPMPTDLATDGGHLSPAQALSTVQAANGSLKIPLQL